MANILIVDDSSLIRKSLTTMFQEMGHTIIDEAVKGEEGLFKYKKHNPDLVTMDINMIGMNGIETVKKIVQYDPNAIIIMVSSVNQKKMVFEALQNGAKHYVLKPIAFDKLKEIVDKVLPQEEKAVEKETEEIKEENSLELEKEPAIIENIDGVFNVKIQKDLKKEDVIFLNTMLQGLLYVNDLRMIINMNNHEFLEKEAHTMLKEIIKRLDQKGNVMNKTEIDEYYEMQEKANNIKSQIISNIK